MIWKKQTATWRKMARARRRGLSERAGERAGKTKRWPARTDNEDLDREAYTQMDPEADCTVLYGRQGRLDSRNKKASSDSVVESWWPRFERGPSRGGHQRLTLVHSLAQSTVVVSRK